jgi:hypothetical protein
MAMRMKWTDTGADFVSATPRALANLRGITDAAPRQERVDVHVYLPRGWATRDAAPRRDQEAKDPELSRRPNNGGSTGGLPLARRDQTVEPGSAGFEDQVEPIGSRVMPGDTFTVGDDCDGNGFSLRRTSTTDQEIERADPVVAVTGHRPTGTAGAADRLARRLAPSNAVSDEQPAALRTMQAMLNEHYRRR